MRLGSCVAIELAVGAGMAAALIVGVASGVRELQDSWDGQAWAYQAPPVAEQVSVVSAEQLTAATPAPPDMSLFDGVSDELLLEGLRGASITRVKKNTGGSSLSFRIDFDSGARAAFKPRQTNLQTVPRREVAAYRLNRWLGLNSVPPAVGAKLPVAELYAKLDAGSFYAIPRIRAEMTTSGAHVIGELSWWIPVIDYAEVDGFRIDSVEGIVTWKRYLAVGVEVPASEWLMVAQISDMVLFDYVINNPDRWSGGNARASDDGRVLYFMDNTMSFGRAAAGGLKSRIYLQRAQKFSRSLVQRLRALEQGTLRELFSGEIEPWDELLADDEITALLSRRDHALRYIDGLIARHGEDEVLVFP